MYQIENEYLKIKVNEKGGSLTSIFDKKRKTELLYQPIKESWQGQDVFIFPFIARLKDGTYSFNGKEYPLKNHGLIRYMKGEGCSFNQDLIISFTSNQETYQRYPFSFKAYSQYHLDNNMLTVTYIIFNESSLTMPFCIGGHPAFLLPGEKKENYFDISGNSVAFEKETKLTRITQEETCCFNTGEEDFGAYQTLSLSKEMFSKINTYIFKAKNIDSITLNKKDGHKIQLIKKNIDFLALWSGNPYGNFIAIEPWNGVPDYLDSKKDITSKKEIINLKPKDKYIFSYSIKVD